MIPLALSEIARVVGGSLVGHDVLVDGPVVTDSREAQAGSLYVARVGEHADGHQFADGAARAGAVATLGSRPVEATPTVVVPDVQDAFASLARSVVDRVSGLNIIGITGSSGKTSTKDLLGQVLAQDGETVAPQGSYNSEVGVPLTLCRVTAATRHLVVEMGASGVGHIAYLTRMAPPRIGIVLNVGHAHVGEFGSVDAIARTKSELVAALPSDGVAVLNLDDPRVAVMAEKTSARVIGVGRSEAADYRAVDVRSDTSGRASFTLVTSEGSIPVTLAVHGEHHVGNALAVLAAAVESGVELAQAVQTLSGASAQARWRMEVQQLERGITLVNDAYNANPESMSAALAALAQIGRERRTVAVLGAMRELGDESVSAHRAVGTDAVARGIDIVVAVGPDASPVADAVQDAAGAAQRVVDADAAYDLLVSMLQPGDVVLFKSSRDSGLRYLGDRITERFEAEDVL
ncbi:UDP-N-acetylmuramoyl-tripeptide--D-alanyl-D-alanine ligase [Allobranchiibius sp. GilTou38]|uniref:UDP-N-acetylmuramoyl-tripeptide--D-alanyl-D- alanine ligase n=1 Tax=Allobranchiibius sp. GilTou38 TaxID=2815210 RepID=UPI001AA16D2B|nr:UDP-N-acetylmuramoyl-tripeptide--D-alanyl-D-alanine ligase [Allobranchiibius sp. GilTou38]MBO1766950.1 UDP-N-acetylmuramoyl-tripeptide--D-alanyl-D-alanine ligase [Allobranchiibius sp. GilTou38]